MSNLFPQPGNLGRAEYVQLVFHLEAREYFDLPPLGLLRLRREFRQALNSLSDSGRDQLVQQLLPVFDPPLPEDLKLRQLVQRPAPPLVLRPDPDRCGLVQPGEQLSLPVLFLGRGIAAIEAFALLLQEVGKKGLVNGQGVCDLVAIDVEDASGHASCLWSGDNFAGHLVPVVNDLGWWLTRQSHDWEQLQLTFQTPARLIHGGKPLFRSKFTDLFPFVLRRVTSMLAAHCHLETVVDAPTLIAAAARVEELDNQLHWQDWRTLDTSGGGVDLGGLKGTLHLTGSDLAELVWLLHLGGLLQIGKGAAYGAGCYDVAAATLDSGSC